MTPEEKRSALMGVLSDNWSTTRIAWPNYSFTPVPTEYWVRPTIVDGDAFEGEKGEGSGLDLQPSILFIDVFCPIGSGTKIGLGYAKTIANLFRRTTLAGTNGDLVCRAPAVRTL